LVEYFVAGPTARTTAGLARVNKSTAAYYYHRLRKLICRAVAGAAPFAGEIEVDESYFGGRRKGKRGRDAAGKVSVFGLLKRGGKVYAVVIADAKATTLLPILKERTVPDSIVYSDSLPSYNAPDMAGFRHPRINHARLFADGKNHINGIENFWNQAKRHLRKFNGVPKKHFPLCLKECEGRFNNPKPQTQLKQLNQWVQQSLTGLSRTAPRINVSVLPPPNPPNLRPKSGNGELSDDLGRSSTLGSDHWCGLVGGWRAVRRLSV